MNDETKSALMAFMDGELGTLSARRMAARLEQEPALRDAWETQYRVSFLLQQGRVGAALASPDFAARVQQAIAAELPQGQRSRHSAAQKWGWSSVAAVTLLSASLFVLAPWQSGSPTSSSLSASSSSAVVGVSRQAFALRPVRFSVTSDPLLHADDTIQRDIQRIWRPTPERYLAWTQSSRRSFSEYPAAGLLPVGLRSEEGIYPRIATYQH
ncbi:sigma-E factor negative regulatory protein [Acidithiobacillus sp. AMEEHan]|uniref:sigma-E factor negative regulatory protein n=1 Tax=Acidithiobacillus sp. AMEEHan TaxID=2994951 RepID=UPI0027E3EB8C|nr:sigma-E factor negative regulatory protein [Acidithiobacillus sp. AMEEHan]